MFFETQCTCSVNNRPTAECIVIFDFIYAIKNWYLLAQLRSIGFATASELTFPVYGANTATRRHFSINAVFKGSAKYSPNYLYKLAYTTPKSALPRHSDNV